MAWSAPRTWVAGETLTAALLNAELRDNMLAAEPVGSLHYYIRAATSVETTVNGFAIEANAASVLRASYAALNTLLSGLSYPFGTADGTHMTLPDTPGRSLVAMAASGHADVDALGDSDGLTKTSRSPKHNSSNNVTISNGSNQLQLGGGSDGYTTSDGTLASAVQRVTMAIGGTVGPGGTRPTDMPAYLVAGTWFVKY
jgi:hypothetical protein